MTKEEIIAELNSYGKAAMEFTTRILHSRAVQKEAEGATLPPIYQVSAFAAETPENLEKVFQHKKSGHSYSRISNPTVDAFERRISELEGGKGAVATSSGMAPMMPVTGAFSVNSFCSCFNAPAS